MQFWETMEARFHQLIFNEWMNEWMNMQMYDKKILNCEI